MVAIPPRNPPQVSSSATKTRGSPKPGQPSTVAYKVKKGDTFTSIAKAHKIEVDALARMNPKISDRDELRAGAMIQVPAPKDAAAASSKSPAPTSNPEAPARRKATPETQQAARRSAARREAAGRARTESPEPAAASRRTTVRTSSMAVQRDRRAGDQAAAAAVDRAGARFGQVEGANSPWSVTRSLNREGARVQASFAQEINTPVEIAKIDKALMTGRVTRAAGTFRNSASAEAAVGPRDGLLLKAGYNNQAIAWGYKTVVKGRNLPLGVTAEGKSKVAAGTFVEIGTETQVAPAGRGRLPTAYGKVGAAGFVGARNLNEGTISSPRGIVTASGTASFTGGAGAALGVEGGLKDGKASVGVNVGAKLGWGIELSGRLEVDYPKLMKAARDTAGRGLQSVRRQFQQTPPARNVRHGWFW